MKKCKQESRPSLEFQGPIFHQLPLHNCSAGTLNPSLAVKASSLGDEKAEPEIQKPVFFALLDSFIPEMWMLGQKPSI